MDKFLGKKYVLTNPELFEDYFVYVKSDDGYKPGKIALDLTQTHILTRNHDGTYNFQFICPVANSIITFTPGVEFELENADGLKIITLITIKDNIMTQSQSVKHWEYEKTTKYVREFYADKMISTTTDGRTKKIGKRHYVVEKLENGSSFSMV